MTLNTAQYIYIKSTQNWEINNAANILSYLSEIILKPIEINLNFYKYKKNIFEYFFKNDKLNTNFVLGLKNEFLHLNSEQQKMYVASCIKLLTKETIASSNVEKLTDLLEIVPNEMTNFYLAKAFESLNEDVLSYVSHKILKYKLEKNLSDNTENSKQPKI